MVLHPALVDGSFQAGMSAQLGAKVQEMYVPFSIGEIEILQPLEPNCFSYVTAVKDDRKGKQGDARTAKSNVLILDRTGKVLVKVRESTGVPLRDVYKKTSASSEDGFRSLHYSYEWERTPLGAPIAGDAADSIVFFETEGALYDGYRSRLKKAGRDGDHAILVRPGGSFAELGEQSYVIDPGSAVDFARLIKFLVEKKRPVRNICFAWSAGDVDFRDPDALKQAMERGVYSFLSLCQALIGCKLENDVQLIYLHSGSGGKAQPHNEAVAGLVKALRLEHPKFSCKVVEVDHQSVNQESVSHQEILDAVLAELQPQSHDRSAVRYEAGERYTARLKAFELEKSAAVPPQTELEKSAAAVPAQAAPRKNGVYLITGGAGGLGLIFAEFLAKEFNARLVLAAVLSFPRPWRRSWTNSGDSGRRCSTGAPTYRTKKRLRLWSRKPRAGLARSTASFMPQAFCGIPW